LPDAPIRKSASVLGIEERTVKAHVAKLMRKVGVSKTGIALSRACHHAFSGDLVKIIPSADNANGLNYCLLS